MLNTSFTLRPSGEDRDRVELTLRRASECSRIATTGGECYKLGERAFKRQRLFMDRCSFSKTSVHSPGLLVEEPKIRRLPYDFEPPSNEGHWKRRCFQMQTICKETRSRMREMEEDQRQLRRRIQELETQLLLQSGTTKHLPAQLEDTASGSRGLSTKQGNEEGNVGKCSSKEHQSGDKTKSGGTPVSNRLGNNKTLPAVLAIPRTQPTSSCFYLTDGEGLSDSELHDDEDIHMDDEDDRNDHGCHHRG